MRFAFVPEAESDLMDAVAFYDAQKPRLGLEFAEEIHSTIARILENPKAWPVLRGRVRRARADRFPYGVCFTLNDDLVLVVAVMHSSRKPDYWHRRQ